jgi:3-methyladenine DNA glycosylase AlkC
VNNDSPVPEHILRRKGSPNTAGVPEEVRRLLNTGRIEAVNLSEWLVVDQGAIAAHCLPALELGQHVPAITAALQSLEKSTTPKRNAAVASALHTGLGSTRAVERAFKNLRQHPSDVIRSWACELVAAHALWSLAEKLDRIRPLAADANMGVRECAWMAVRNDIAAHLEEALTLLVPFVHDPDPNIRRFATEATRPRGVWCRHIHALREDPAKGLVLLEPVRSDPARYVQNSVANWLNDASKSQPDWVQDLCRRWQKESATAETAYICRRALRTLTKSAKPKP